MTETFFQTSNHRDRFVHAIEAIHKVDGAKYDPEYAAALYILTYGSGLWSKSQSYVTRHGINFEEMLHEVDLSGGQSVMVLLAANLFNNTQHVDPLEFLRLDSGNFHVALNAIKIRRNGLSVLEVQDEEEPPDLVKEMYERIETPYVQPEESYEETATHIQEMSQSAEPDDLS
jgi:hypothetical protein